MITYNKNTVTPEILLGKDEEEDTLDSQVVGHPCQVQDTWALLPAMSKLIILCDLRIGILEATLSDAWSYRVSAKISPTSYLATGSLVATLLDTCF